jgi:tRNA G18 (ribose-2'-O)-methylase SpoU
MISNRNITKSLQNKSDNEIKELINNNKFNFVNLALNIHGELNIGNMIRSSHLCGCNKFIIFGRRRYDKRSCVGVSHYINIERILGIRNVNEHNFKEILDDNDYILDDNIFYNFIINNNYLPIFIEQTKNSIIANDNNIKNILTTAKKLNLIPIFIYGNECHGIPKNILDLKDKFIISYTLELLQKGVIPSYNVSNCLSIISYKIMEIYNSKII